MLRLLHDKMQAEVYQSGHEAIAVGSQGCAVALRHQFQNLYSFLTDLCNMSKSSSGRLCITHLMLLLRVTPAMNQQLWDSHLVIAVLQQFA